MEIWLAIIVTIIILIVIVTATIFHKIVIEYRYYRFKSRMESNQMYLVKHRIINTKKYIYLKNLRKNAVCIRRDYKYNKILFYEYKIENTILPNVIENIIKEYIGYRLIQGFNSYFNIMVDYPYNFVYNNFTNCEVAVDIIIPHIRLVNKKKNNILLTYERNIFRFHDSKVFKHKIELEGGFEIQYMNNLLDIKIQ